MTLHRSPLRILVISFAACALLTSRPVQADGFPSEGVSNSAKSPVKSITDRRTANGLLRRSREALADGNIELAEWYVEQVERSGIDYSAKMFQRFVDSPEKVREAIAQKKASLPLTDAIARANTLNAPTTAADVPPPATQPTIPVGIPATGSANATQLEAAISGKKSKAVALIERSRRALAQGNTSEAVAWYHSVSNLDVDFVEGEFGPKQLRQQLVAAGVSKNLLTADDTAPPADPHLSITDPAQFAQMSPQLPTALETPEASYVDADGQLLAPEEITSSSLLERAEMIKTASVAESIDPETNQERDSAMQLIAEARASLDRGDLEMAEQFAKAAQELAVPDEAYAPGDPRPWMVLAEINKRQEGQATFEQIAEQGPAFNAPPVMESAPANPQPLPNQAMAAEVRNSPDDMSQVITTSAEVPTANRPDTAFPSPVQLAQAHSAPVQNAPPLAPPGEMDARLSDLVPPSSSNQSVPNPYVDEPAAPVGEASAGPRLLTPPSSNETMKAPPEQPAPDVIDNERANEAVRLFNAGQEALSEQKLGEAREKFLAAWKYEADLPAEVRQALQDNLQLTRTAPPNRLASVPPTGMSEIERAAVDKLLAEISREQAIVRQEKQTDPFKAWERLKSLRATVAAADVDSSSRGQLLTRVNRQIKDMELYVDQNRAKFENDQRNKRILDEIDRERAQKVRNQEQLAELVEQFNDLMEQQRFPEAVVIAKKAREIDPLEPVVQTMVWRSQVARQVMTNMMRNEDFRENAMGMLNDVDRAADPVVGDNPLVFPGMPEWEDLTHRRRKALAASRRRYTDVEIEIQRALKEEVDVKFENQPLSYVIDQLARTAGINAFIDPEGLAAEGVTSDTPVSIKLRKPVSLRSALNLILQPLHLSYVIQDEVLRITSEQVRDGDVYSDVYHVADLVIPIPNFVPGYNLGLPGAIREAHNVLGHGYMGGATQRGGLTMMADSPGVGPAANNASVLAQMGASGMVPSAGQNAGPYGMGSGSSGGGSQADFDTLIELITTTIDPDTWEEVGGQGTIAGFPTNLSLVVQQTQEVHNKIADLLAQLRRLQDLQVTIEVRFITLNDDFFERIGVDFDFDIDDNTGLSTTALNNLDDSGPSVTVGLDPTGVPNVDLDIGFTQGSFGTAVPQFGGFDANSAANIGFAILSDIEAFFVIQAAQGDSRTNILQAPKVTLFNGQTAFVSDTSNRPFVTSVIPVVGDFAAAHQPVITVLTEGTSLTVQAVVSQDRRFVRLTLVPFFSQIGDVDTFTFEGTTNSDTGTTAVDPTDETQTVRDNAINNRQGTTVQLPTFAFTTVSTTVSVPDGGTILLGGIKRLSEGRTEQGVPILSKLPYVNRLFKNVGIGRTTQSLMMMVTPRIIIQEEEEEKLGIASP